MSCRFQLCAFSCSALKRHNLIAAATIIDAGGLVRCRPMRSRALSTAAGAPRTAASATCKLRDCAPMPSRFTGACVLRPASFLGDACSVCRQVRLRRYRAVLRLQCRLITAAAVTVARAGGCLVLIVGDGLVYR